ncbi:putative ubiquitin [Medicago truncatula]|uniref:Putative ubiquitin n=1 Tax=Medicago truncatula TaxID=3880 RepID=G7K959_MEDTR|nr:ubiquitin-40S ribosomal S27a-like protein [Medicago truncatula]RHN56033.1 putative ubiquitin [Medicago truncatula]
MMLIFIKTMESKVIPLRVKSSDTIDSVKEKIFDKEKYQVNDQRLIFSGKQLDDCQTIANYNIQEKSTIHLILRTIGD